MLKQFAAGVLALKVVAVLSVSVRVLQLCVAHMLCTTLEHSDMCCLQGLALLRATDTQARETTSKAGG